jgi:DNA-directed DNA polymerase III PolC
MSKFKNFISNHVHIQSLDSASTVDAFIKRELELETGYITVTDHGYLGACLDVYREGRKKGLKPILGLEAYHRDDSCDIILSGGIDQDKLKEYYKYGHFTLHCLDQDAYHAVMRKVSDRDLTAELHGSERKPIFTWDDIAEIGQYNITATSGCLIGVVSRHLMSDRPDLAVKYYEKMRSLIKPGNFYADIYPHRCDKNWVNGVFITLEDGTKIKHYLGKKVKTTEHDEITVAELSKVFKKNKDVGKLTGIKNRNTWEHLEPKQITNCEFVQDFIQNECRPWCPDGDVQLGANKFIIELANKYGDPIVIADDSHYAHPEEKFAQEAKLGGMGDSFKFYGKYHRQSSDEAFEYFNKYMGLSERDFEAILDNNKNWASRFDNFTLKYDISLPSKFYPEDTLSYLKTLIDKHGRMDWSNQKMVERLKEEIQLFKYNGKMDWLPYFFGGEEALEQYEKRGELTGPGRGSSAGVLINYLLNITHLNPLDWELSLERFMTPDRLLSGNPPDIDFDLPDKEVLVNAGTGWLKKRFGDCFIPLSTNLLLRLKSSIKDVARHKFGEVPYEIEKLTKTIPDAPQGVEDLNFIHGYVAEDGTEHEGLLKTHSGLQEYVKKYPDHWELVLQLLGIMRGKSRHASACIIANKPADSFLPIMTVGGVRVTQYTAKACEWAGGIKYDFLGLRTLIDLSEAVKIIQERYSTDLQESYILNGKKVPKHRIVPVNGKLYDIYDLPDDPAVFNSICEGDTVTVFQVNTSGALKWLKEFNVIDEEGNKLLKSKMDIATFTALDRPGPLDAYVTNDKGRSRNMLQEYAARLKGEKSYDDIEFINNTIVETRGILIFQESVTKIYQELTSCTRAEAEAFRRLISKKEVDKINKEYPLFLERAAKKVGEEEAKKIWSQIYTFSQYGFCKAHAASYGVTAYACAFLKQHYPLEWWCAVLRNAEKNDVAEKFWKHCKHLVTLPDIRYSKVNYYIHGDKIIAPLSLLHGVGEKAHEELVKYGPYKDIEDFCNKINFQKQSTAKTDGEKVKAGRSALHSGIVNSLIVSGVTNSLFPEGLDLIGKMEFYEATIAKVLNKKPKKIPEEYRTVNKLSIYQHRKAILPIYSEFLAPYLYTLQIDGIVKREKQTLEYSYNPVNESTLQYIQKSSGGSFVGPVSFVNGSILKFFNEDAIINEDQPITIAVAAYVIDHRRFNYKNKKTGEMMSAMEFILDVDGEVFKTVKWPDRRSNEPSVPEGKITDSIVIAIISRRSNNYGFSIDAVIKVQEPLE